MSKKTVKSNLPSIHREGGFFETFSHLQDKIRARAHDIFRARQPWEGDQVTDWLQAESEVLTTVAMQFMEEDDKYVLRGEVPGFSADEVDIHIEDDMLVVGGSHKTSSKKKTNGQIRTESSEVNFFRRMLVPADADVTQIAAQVEGGVLEVVLPKSAGGK